MIAYDPIIEPLLLQNGYQVDVLRLDQVHPEISGNKWFKLKYNLQKAISGNFDTVVTFGGAFSNHISATAAACKLAGLKSIAIIRGEESDLSNPTLKKAIDDGMQLHVVSRGLYAQKNSADFKTYLEQQFGRHYLIPEGGNNEAGVLGCMEILNPAWNYDYILCACGTATTFAGLVAAAKPSQQIIGISVLKGENKLPVECRELLRTIFPEKEQNILGNEGLARLQNGDHCITNEWCFSGYARNNKTLTEFKNRFETEYRMPLDYVYTNKLFYAALELMVFERLRKNSRLLIIHSGGLQGNAGFEKRYHLMPSL